MKKSYWLVIIGALIILAALYWIYDRNQNNMTITNQTPDSAASESTAADSSKQAAALSTAANDGLKIEVLQAGNGAAAKAGDQVSVHYTGTFTDGKKFDSSLDRGQPFAFTLGAGQVIKGWDEGLVGMQVGEKRRMTIPYQLGYGETGYGPIPAKATLIFDIELLSIK